MKLIYIAIFLIEVVFSNVFAASTSLTGHNGEILSPDGTLRVKWTCLDEWHEKCAVSINDKAKQIALLRSEKRLPASIEWLSKDLVRFHISCGTDCYNWIFYDRYKGRSPPYANGKDVDAKRLYVLGLAKSDFYPDSNSPVAISVMDIYSEKVLQRIVLDNFAPVVSIFSGIEEAKFTDDGNIYIKYLTGKYFLPREITVSLVKTRHDGHDN